MPSRQRRTGKLRCPADAGPSDLDGDKGLAGTGVITPIRKPPHRDLSDSEKQFNTGVNMTRDVIEQTIAHFKTWRICTPTTGDHCTFRTTISTVIALHFYRGA